LVLSGGERAALEVTSVVDAVLITLDHEMTRQGHVIPAPTLRRRWSLHLAEDACPPPIGKSYAALKRRVEAHVPMVLAGLEAHHVHYFQLEEWGMQPSTPAALALRGRFLHARRGWRRHVLPAPSPGAPTGLLLSRAPCS
jgi:hypothetical protein